MSTIQLLTIVLSLNHWAVAHRIVFQEARAAIENSDSGGPYPKADKFEPDWTTEKGLSETRKKIAQVKKDLNARGADPTPAQAEVLADSIPFGLQGMVRRLQGQHCIDLCVLCSPKPEELISGDLPTLRTVKVTRGKSAKDFAKAIPLGAVDAVLGGASGALKGAFDGLGGGFLVGGATGIVTHNLTSGKVGSLAGTVLGWAAGVSVGGGSAAVGAAALGTGGLVAGALKGIDIVASFTDCGRVGFTQYSNGKDYKLDSDGKHPFVNAKKFGREYGLKKLREWNSKHTGQDYDTTLQEGSDDDLKYTTHCEHLRSHDFDIRHASECVRHSQLCNGPGLVMPGAIHAQCRLISNATLLEEAAVAAGDDPNTGMFAQWRKLQDKVKEETVESFSTVVSMCSVLPLLISATLLLN